MRKALISLLAVAAIVVWSMLGRSAPESSPAAVPDHAPSVGAASGATLSDRSVPAPRAVDPVSNLPVPPSMAGADIDGGVRLDADGKLIPDVGLRQLFDHVLTAIGELSLDEVRALLAARLQQTTTPEGARQALAAFELYLRYLREADQAAPRLAAMALPERLQALRELRRSVLGTALAEAFFGLEETYQAHTLAVQAIDPALSEDERQRQEQALIDRLPPSLAAPIIEHRQTAADLADAEAISTLAGDADERYRLRSERFGEAAAARMELLDRERAEWQARVDGYRQLRDRLRATNADADPALAQYLESHFSEAEQRRIRSLEAIDQL
jgi:lipase chaperone LimK